MKDHESLLKARYCRAIMRTAARCPDDEARTLIYCLATERLTADTSSYIKAAEREALGALLALSTSIRDRSIPAVAGEWKTAADAITRWIDAAS